MKLASLCLVSACALAMGCSASAPPDPSGADESSSELRALNPAEIVGTIAYGDTKTVSYSYDGKEAAKYKALSFTAAAGDAIDVWVRSSSGDARLWLLDASYANVALNNDASGSTHDAHVAVTVRKGGTYYIAVRDNAYDDADFTVSLTGGHSTHCDPEEENCDPQPSNDPFALTCSGTALDANGMLAYFAPGAISTAPIGTVHVYGRVRACNSTTGCAAWQRDDTVLKDDGGSSSGALRTETNGTVMFGVNTQATSDAMRYYLTFSGGTGMNCTLAGACTVNNNLYIYYGGAYFESKTLNWSHSNISVGVGHRCLSGTIVGTHALDNQRYTEINALIYATFSAAH